MLMHLTEIQNKLVAVYCSIKQLIETEYSDMNKIRIYL